MTLHHDDDNESGYADWWQVETLDGVYLDRRVLTHRHTSEPFTRSLMISFAPDISWIVIRGHDQDHGYGGQVMLLNVTNQEKIKVNQGEDPQDFSEYFQ